MILYQVVKKKTTGKYYPRTFDTELEYGMMISDKYFDNYIGAKIALDEYKNRSLAVDYASAEDIVFSEQQK